MQKKLPNPKNHKIYFDYATETLDKSYIQYEYRVDQVLQSKGYTNTNYTNLKFEGENHSEASWQKRLDIPLNLCLENKYVMKSPFTTSLRKQTPIIKKAIPYVTAKK